MSPLANVRHVLSDLSGNPLTALVSLDTKASVNLKMLYVVPVCSGRRCMVPLSVRSAPALTAAIPTRPASTNAPGTGT